MKEGRTTILHVEDDQYWRGKVANLLDGLANEIIGVSSMSDLVSMFEEEGLPSDIAIVILDGMLERGRLGRDANNFLRSIGLSAIGYIGLSGGKKDNVGEVDEFIDKLDVNKLPDVVVKLLEERQ